MIPLHGSGRIDRYEVLSASTSHLRLCLLDVDQGSSEITFHDLAIDDKASEDLRSLWRQLVDGSPWKVVTGSSGDTMCRDQKRMGAIVFKRDFIWLYPPRPWWRFFGSSPHWQILGIYRPV